MPAAVDVGLGLKESPVLRDCVCVGVGVDVGGCGWVWVGGCVHARVYLLPLRSSCFHVSLYPQAMLHTGFSSDFDSCSFEKNFHSKLMA